MDNSIEIINKYGKVYIPDVTVFDIVATNARHYNYNDCDVFELVLTAYIHTLNGEIEDKDDITYELDNANELNECYEKVKEILKKKVEEKEKCK